MAQTAIIYATGGDRPGCIISATSYSDPEDNVLMACGEGEAILWVNNPPPDLNAYYVGSTEGVTERPTMGITQSKATVATNATPEDTITFSGVPAGATAAARKWTGTVTDGTLVLAMTLAGGFSVKFSLWPYMDATFYAEAIPSSS